MAVDFCDALAAETEDEDSAVMMAPRSNCRMRQVLYMVEVRW